MTDKPTSGSNRNKRAGKRRPFGRFFLLILLISALAAAKYWNLLPQRSYTARDFGIETAVSSTDYNGNGRDDYCDLLLGAREDAKNHPTYDGRYCEGGYPAEDIGVCSDLVWRAFRAAGYSLKDMVDADIQARPAAYTAIESPDPNIDFRRVRNLRVFFEAYTPSLTTDLSDIAAFQPGDVLIFGNDEHIGIASDKRNAHGVPYLIHNSGQPNREEDVLGRTNLPLTGHYRFDAGEIPDSVLLPWQD